MSTIPASTYVNVIPGVLSAGGSAIDLNGLVLTKNTRVPIGTVQSFASDAAVSAYFGAASQEAVIAGGGTGNGSGYFGGYTNATAQPGALLFAQYPESAVSAYLRGGSVAGLTIAQLQALTGSLTVTIDGYPWVAASINLSAASSFSAAAALIEEGLQGTDPQEASFTAALGASFTGSGSGTNLTATSVTGYISAGDVVSGTGVPGGTTIVSQTSGSAGGAGVYVTSNSTTASSASLTTASNVLVVTAVASGTLSIGQSIDGETVASDTVIAALGTGEGLTGTYIVSTRQQVASESMTSVATAFTVTYDSVSGGFLFTSGITGTASLAAFATGTLAASLMLTAANGAVTSQGAAATTPAAFMAALILLTQNWATFMTAFDPDGGSGNSQKLAFAAWANGTSNRYAYVCWDTDITPTESVPATTSLGYIIQQAGYSGTCLIYEPSDLNLAAFVCGFVASINFTQTNGRATAAYKSQSGLVASVSNQQAAINLGGNPQVAGSDGNGYNYYGAVATANQSFLYLYPGSISGEFDFLDSYVNQIYLNSQFQLALLNLLTTVGSIPYNAAGYALMEAALQDPINAGLNFGSIRAGVTLSAAQIAEVNNAAGSSIASTLSARGWYLQIQDASPQVRQGRGSPPCTIWYVDGESVQSISLNSIDVQ